MKSFLLIKVSTKPKSHFPHMLQMKGQREYWTWKCKCLSPLFVSVFFCWRITSLSFQSPILLSAILVVLFIIVNESITDVCRSLWHFMRCCSGQAMQQPQCFLRCRHDLSPQGRPWGTSAPHMGWCNQISVLFSVTLKNNVQLQEFNKVIAGVQWKNITSVFILMILVKLSGMKLTHGTLWHEDLNNVLLRLSSRWQLVLMHTGQ